MRRHSPESFGHAVERRTFLKCAVAGPASVLGVWSATTAVAARLAEPLDVGNRKQQFIDDRFIARSQGVTLRQNRPDLQRENLLLPEHAWESGMVCAMGSVAQQEGKIMLWYDARKWDAAAKQPENTRRLCYAESTDGVRFTKPSVGLFELDGSKENNIVSVGATGDVFRDEHDAPQRRFKAIMDMRPDVQTLPWSETEGVGKHWTCLFTSPDGIHWKRSPQVVFPLYLGHKQSAIWDDRLQKWVLYLRAHRPHRCFGRVEVEAGKLGEPYPFQPLPGKNYDPPGSVALTSELPIVMDRDEEDPPGGQPYTMNAWKDFQAEDAYFAFVPMWYDARRGTGASDRVEVQLAVSRDGVEWRRPWRTPLISPGSPSLAASGQIWPLSAPVIRDGEIWLYYLSSPEAHLGRRQPPGYQSDAEKPFYADPRPNTSVVARAIWRMGRLVAAEASPDGGWIVTPPIRFQGERLIVNADCGASGSLRVGLERPDGDPIPGYASAEAIPVQGNGLALPVRWRAAGNLGRLAAEPVRLRFELKGADLYSFQFS